MIKLNWIKFIKKEEVGDNIYSFYFDKPKNVSFKSGQYGLFVMPSLVRPHPFSLSSSPSDEYICFTTTIHNESPFKNKLMKFKKDSKLLMVGPLQNFYLYEDDRKYLFLAQGIGITPFKSILEERKARNISSNISLIHVSKNDHVFGKITNKLADKAYYPHSAQDFQQLLSNNLEADYFYIAGSKRFVNETKLFLQKNNIDSNKIVGDAFLGYKY